ncbi:MAG: ion transporter, partial [Selenomonadaceae bacterium]|nr:ion transporter [Selenomonadaceae bacterium]
MNMLENLLNWKYTQKIITFVIIVNAIVLGILTDKTLSADEISCLEAIDRLCLVIFVIELIAKLAVY